ncbi:hypothetical protein Q1695_010216 [Nippostrongylus brasiliensis]|nr:hypothetical protein Q1695_010216 [Nippostrongylus brasiliensis]
METSAPFGLQLLHFASQNVQRAGVRSPLTPVGSPDVRSRTAESLHKTTSTGKTVDIMILPRTADENERGGRPKTADMVAPPGVEEKPPVKDGTITAPIDAAKTEFQDFGR